jgi:hypothetical protein
MRRIIFGRPEVFGRQIAHLRDEIKTEGVAGAGDQDFNFSMCRLRMRPTTGFLPPLSEVIEVHQRIEDQIELHSSTNGSRDWWRISGFAPRPTISFSRSRLLPLPITAG